MQDTFFLQWVKEKNVLAVKQRINILRIIKSVIILHTFFRKITIVIF